MDKFLIDEDIIEENRAPGLPEYILADLERLMAVDFND